MSTKNHRDDARPDREQMTLTPEREHELAEWLVQRTDPDHPNYSAALTRELRRTRPDWFAEGE